jgi:hypothetical protein
VLIGFIVGKVAATFWAPVFPEIRPAGVRRCRAWCVLVMLICALASTLAIRVALRVDPADGHRGLMCRNSAIRIEGLRKRYGEGDMRRSMR